MYLKVILINTVITLQNHTETPTTTYNHCQNHTHVFDTIPLQSLPRAHPPQSRCHRSPVLKGLQCDCGYEWLLLWPKKRSVQSFTFSRQTVIYRGDCLSKWRNSNVLLLNRTYRILIIIGYCMGVTINSKFIGCLNRFADVIRCSEMLVFLLAPTVQ